MIEGAGVNRKKMAGIAMVIIATTVSASSYNTVKPLWSSTPVSQNISFKPMGIDIGTTGSHGQAGYSVECLGCHDGVNAKNAFITRRMSSSQENLNLRALAGSFKQHHPVNITYIEGKAGLKPVTTALKGAWKGGVTTIADILVDGRVECSSCHLDPHVTDPDTMTLRNSNSRSVLCTSCHNQ